MFYPCQSYHTYVKSTNAKGTNDALLKNKDSNKKIIFLTLKRIEEGIVYILFTTSGNFSYCKVTDADSLSDKGKLKFRPSYLS